MIAWLLVVHVFGFLLWVSGLLTASLALSKHSREPATEARQAFARLERTLLRGLADPGAFLTIVAGAFLMLSNRAYYLHARWLHIKLIFVAILIVLHWIMGARSKAFSSGRATLQPNEVRLLFVGILLVVVSILIATLPGEVLLT